jgi:hypothetical protein
MTSYHLLYLAERFERTGHRNDFSVPHTMWRDSTERHMAQSPPWTATVPSVGMDETRSSEGPAVEEKNWQEEG